MDHCHRSGLAHTIHQGKLGKQKSLSQKMQSDGKSLVGWYWVSELSDVAAPGGSHTLRCNLQNASCFYFAERPVSHLARIQPIVPTNVHFFSQARALALRIFLVLSSSQNNTTDHKTENSRVVQHRPSWAVRELYDIDPRGRYGNSRHIWVWLATHARGRYGKIERRTLLL